MSGPALLPLGVAVVAAWALLGLTLGRGGVAWQALRSALAVGLGLGLHSVGWFLGLVVLGPAPRLLGIWEVAAAAALAGAIALARRRGSLPAEPPPPVAAGPGERWVAVAVFLLLLLTVVVFAQEVRDTPRGGWDALAIWNTRARFLYRGGEHWRDAFSPHIFHADYPLNLPALVASAWSFAGSETQAVPLFVSALFTLGAVLLLGGVVGTLRGRQQGLLASAALLATTFLARHGATQTADVPFAFYVLAAAGLLLVAPRCERGRQTVLVLAGASAGLAAWTKNEGLLFVLVALPAGCVAASAWRRSVRETAGDLALLALGAAPALALVLWFKVALAPANDLVAGQGSAATLARIADLSRYGTIGREYLRTAFQFPVLLLGGYALLLGGRRRSPGEPAEALAAFAVCAVMLGGYTAVYLTTPIGLQQHLDTSLKRLFLQLWPLVLLAFFLRVRSPEPVPPPGEPPAEAS